MVAARAALSRLVGRARRRSAPTCWTRSAALIIERKRCAGQVARRARRARPSPKPSARRCAPGRIFKYFAGEALRRHGQNLDSVRPGVEIQTYREAVGVYGLITPWNFPIAIPAWKIAPALGLRQHGGAEVGESDPGDGARCCRPSSTTRARRPVSSTWCWAAALSATPSSKHPDVNGISFTGSQTVGAKVAAAAVARMARVQLEMGGKNPLVVLDDAELGSRRPDRGGRRLFRHRPALHRRPAAVRAGRHLRQVRRRAGEAAPRR